MSPHARGVRRDGSRSAAAYQSFASGELRPKWDPRTLQRTDERVVARFVLSVRAMQLLLGSEGYGGIPAPVSAQTILGLCTSGALDWIDVAGPDAKFPVRAFDRLTVERYFDERRGGHHPPWHRLPIDVRQALGLDF